MLQLYFFVCIRVFVHDFALVAELVDAADLKSVGSNPVPVRFRPSAPLYKTVPKGTVFAFLELIKGKSDNQIFLKSNFQTLSDFIVDMKLDIILFKSF